MNDFQEKPSIPPFSDAEKQVIADETLDSQSAAETKQLSSGKPESALREDTVKFEEVRAERFRDHFETIAVLSLYIVWMALVGLTLIWLYHLVAPAQWWHLPLEQVKNIQAIITGGALAGFAIGQIKKSWARA